MGMIDLDPCAETMANPNVPASAHFTEDDDGLKQEWWGKVFMNPPYGRQIGDWCNKLVADYRFGIVTEAIALLPARTDTLWFRKMRNFPACFVTGRLKFGEASNTAPFPSVLFYLGQNLSAFFREFAYIGDIWTRIELHDTELIIPWGWR